MFENIVNFFKSIGKKEEKKRAQENSKEAAKERLHLVLMQDRANVSADFLELMKQEIIDVIKKYIEVDEKEIDVRLTNKENEDGTNGAPALYANIPILNIKNDARKIGKKEVEEQENKENAKKEETTEVKQEEAKEKSEKTIEEDKKEQTEKQEEIKDEKEEVTEKEETVNQEDNPNKEDDNKKKENEDREKQETAKEVIKEVIERIEDTKTVKSKK